jgi:putative cell wall-binding protein
MARWHRISAVVVAAFSLLAGLTASATPAGATPASGSGVAAAGTPGILKGVNNQAAGNWTITLVSGSQWSTNDTIVIKVNDSANVPANPYVTFHTKPQTVAAADGNATPTFSTALTDPSTYTVTFTNGSGSIPHTQTFTVSGIAYDVNAAAANGPVTVSATYNGVTTNFSSASASNATVSPVAGSIVAGSNATMHPSTATPGANVGDWTVTLAAGSTWASGDTITVTVKDAGGSTSTVSFDTANPKPAVNVPAAGNSTLTPSAAVATGSPSADQLTITLTGTGGTLTDAQPIDVTGLRYDAGTAAVGAVQVTDSYTSGASTTAGALDNSNASNATIATVPSISLEAASTPTVGVGNASQAAGNWSLGLYTKGAGWGATDTVVIVVGDVHKSNCGAGSDNVGFASTPTVAVAVTSDQTTAPTLSAAIGQTATCAGSSVKDALVLSFTNTGTITGSATTAPYPVTVTISNVAYTLGVGTPLGNLAVASAYETTPGAAPSITSGSTTAATTGPSNATVNGIFIATNSPAVAVAPSTVDAPVSNVVLTEAVAKAVPAGWVCVTLSAGTFDKNATPAVSASGGGAAVASSVSGSGATTATLSFDVTTASSTAPATYTLSGLAVDAPATAQIVNLTIKDAGTAAGCGTASTLTTAARAYGALASGRISGSDADGTAVAEMEAQFPPGTTCPTSKSVVVATDGGYPDALAASYLAGQLGTGILLTPTNSLSAETAAAIQAEGITTVYVVGGPVAVSDAVVQQLQAQQAYNCGGTTGVTSNGSPVDLTVSRIYGTTLYDTAAAIAESTGSSAVGNAEFPGAYNAYDAVGGAASPSATTGTTAVPTAILATGAGFQDATSASPMAYADHFPVLLTDPSSLSAQASSAMSVLGIQQVIVMGGPVAISDNVISQLEAQGLEVVRVAGVDYTDTAVQLALFELSATNGGGVTDGLDWVAKYNKTIELSRGDFYTDGLAGCVVAGPNEQPILLAATPTSIGQYLAGFLQATGATGTAIPVLAVNALGGPQAIDPNLLTSVLDNISAG